MCRLMVCNITDVMSTQKIQIKVLCLTDHVREERKGKRVRDVGLGLGFSELGQSK